MKLRKKIRLESKIIKKYDKPEILYGRTTEQDNIPEEAKNRLRNQYTSLKPIVIK